jgi:hypothetical protein
MTDGFDGAVRQAMRHHAEGAPVPDGLLETVKVKSRRRALRDRAAGALAVLVLAAGITTAVTWSPEAEPAVGALFGADAVSVCVQTENGRVTGIGLAESREGSDVDSDWGESVDGTVALRHTLQGTRFTVTVEVYEGPLSDGMADDARPVRVAGRDGRIGDSTTGDGRVLAFETGVAGTVIRLSTEDPAPEDAQLVQWAETFDIHTDPARCGRLPRGAT